MKSTLLLNASYEPLSIVSTHRALCLLMQNKAVSVDDSSFTITTGGGNTIVLPYVLRLNYEVKRSGKVRPVKFSRRGVLIRDNYICGYCGEYGDTIDHIHPRSQGGPSTFENCVTACERCNRKKSDKTLKEMGWTLRKQPKPPSAYSVFLERSRHDEKKFRTWLEYVSWYDPAIRDKKEELLSKLSLA